MERTQDLEEQINTTAHKTDLGPMDRVFDATDYDKGIPELQSPPQTVLDTSSKTVGNNSLAGVKSDLNDQSKQRV